jgi:hypothetical protein
MASHSRVTDSKVVAPSWSRRRRALAFVGRIDALLDEVPRPHALVASLGQGEAAAVADGPRGTGYR